MQVEPLYDRVLVQQDPEKETIGAGLLVAAEEHREKPLQGTVVAVGCGRLMDSGSVVPPRVAVGDRVIFGRFNGVDLPEDLLGKNLKIMREDEIMAVRRG